MQSSSRAILVRLLLAMTLLSLASCKGDPPESSARPKSNPAFQVDKLFEHEGCTIYRFNDAGANRYYSKCVGAETRTFWSENCGKSCTRHMEM